MKYFENISLTSFNKREKLGNDASILLILKYFKTGADGMETSKRRDCDISLKKII